MNIEEFREICLSLDGTTEKMPFGKFARRYDSLLVFYVMGHMYCMIDTDDFSHIEVRSTAPEIEQLENTYSAVSQPLNKAMRYWVRLDLNSDIPLPKILDLVRRAYNIIKAKYQRQQPTTTGTI